MSNYDYLYNKKYYGDLLKIKHRVEKQLSWRNNSSATVLPYMAQDIFDGGMLDEQEIILMVPGFIERLVQGTKPSGHYNLGSNRIHQRFHREGEASEKC